ncbi:MAG TPA: aldo/keto reductase [Trichocoleus sp.]
MRTYTLPSTDLEMSRIAYGCMNIGGAWDDSPLTDDLRKTAERAVMTAVEAGITLFDHADIYTWGKSEQVFGELLKASPSLRDRIVLQTKCGIRIGGQPQPSDPPRYDFSYEHIISAVESSLHRLHTDYIDVLLLHRPDPLVQPEEVARALDALATAGKVRYFGVSNHTPWQIELLKRNVAQPLLINQVELSLLQASLIDEGVVANLAGATPTPGLGTLDYCRAKTILVQAWGPLASGKLFTANPDPQTPLGQTAQLVAQMAQDKQTAPEAIMLAWLLRHPAGIQPIVGSTRPERIQACCLADTVELTREEWYTLFTAARGRRVP